MIHDLSFACAIATHKSGLISCNAARFDFYHSKKLALISFNAKALIFTPEKARLVFFNVKRNAFDSWIFLH